MRSVIAVLALIVTTAGPAMAVEVWDTGSPLGSAAAPQRAKGWRAVPQGRSYSPTGDVVMEGGPLTIVLQPRSGSIALYSTAQPTVRRAVLCPLELKGKPASIASIRLSEKSADAVGVLVSLTGRGKGPSVTALLTLAGTGILTVKPGEGMNGLSVGGMLAGAIVPSLLGDDLIYEPGNLPAGGTLSLPSENWVLGLFRGEESVLVMTWPKGSQQVRCALAGTPPAPRGITSIDLTMDGKGVSLALVEGRGVWHREELQPAYLERDVTSTWRPPFPARWLTQLIEDDVPTTFEFRDAKKDVWRGAFGNYTYPVWLGASGAVYSLGKKIPPEGVSVAYFLERAGSTPASVLAPADVARQTLDAETLESVLDVARREVRSPGRPNYVVGAAACATTDKLQPIFDAGQEVEKAEYVKAGTEDMIYQSTFLRARADAYQEFGRQMIAYLASVKQEHPELQAYVADLEGVTQQLFAAFEAAKEPMHDLAYARELARQTIALTQEKRPSNLAGFLKLKADWRGMGGTLEGLNRKLHSTARLLLQQAGYGCAERPAALPVAAEVRRRTKAMLAHSNYYETWTTY